MKHPVSLLAWAGIASAFPHLGGFVDTVPSSSKAFELRGRQAAGVWQAPRAGDVRAPCPGLNTLANEGYINRSGRGISAADVQNGFLAAFGMGADATAAGANNAVNLCSSQTHTTCKTFDLDMLNQPHAIEHDASLSRLDRQMADDANADNAHFNPMVWGMTMAIYSGHSHIDVSLANTARLRRVEQARSQDAAGWFQENVGGSLAEHAFTLTSMDDPAAAGAHPQARVDWVDYWFRNERLPTALGWVKPTVAISNNVVNSVANAVNHASTYPPPAPTTTAKPTKSPAPPPPASTAPSASSKPAAPSKSAAPSTAAVDTTCTTDSATKKPAATSTPRYPTVMPYRNSSIPVTSSTHSSTSIKVSSSSSGISSSSKAMTTPAPYASASASASAASASASAASASASAASASSASEASKTSAAQSYATALAGPAPPKPNAYEVSYSPSQWTQITEAIGTYVQHVSSICKGLIGAWGMGNADKAWKGWQHGSDVGSNHGGYGNGGGHAAQYGAMGSGSPAATCACS